MFLVINLSGFEFKVPLVPSGKNYFRASVHLESEIPMLSYMAIELDSNIVLHLKFIFVWILVMPQLTGDVIF